MRELMLEMNFVKYTLAQKGDLTPIIKSIHIYRKTNYFLFMSLQAWTIQSYRSWIDGCGGERRLE